MHDTSSAVCARHSTSNAHRGRDCSEGVANSCCHLHSDEGSKIGLASQPRARMHAAVHRNAFAESARIQACRISLKSPPLSAVSSATPSQNAREMSAALVSSISSFASPVARENCQVPSRRRSDKTQTQTRRHVERYTVEVLYQSKESTQAQNGCVCV